MAVADLTGRGVVAAAHVVDRGRHAEVAPGLVDAQVGHNVRNAEAVVGRALDGVAAVGRLDAVDGPARRRSIAGAVLVVRRRVFERQRVGHAVAELNRVRPEVFTRRTGVTRGPGVQVRVGAAEGVHVEERLCTADREARELDERAIPVGQAVVRRTVVTRRGAGARDGRRRLVPAGADVRAQGAVFGLRARIEGRDRTNRVVDVVGVFDVVPGRGRARRRCRTPGRSRLPSSRSGHGRNRRS